MSLNITSQQIIDNRNARKAAGLVGCISGRPAPALDFFGYKDVQIWNRDASGRLNGDPGFDRMNPGCFCFDCRSAFDPRAEVDLQLILDGHSVARWTYAELLPSDAVPPREDARLNIRSNADGIPPSLLLSAVGGDAPSFRQPPLPQRSASGGIVPPLLPRVDTTQPTYGSFSEIPTSLPAPRARDILNESPDERIRGDLGILRGKLQSKLVLTMDRARQAVCYDDPTERDAFLATVRADEQALWRKLDAVDLLLNN